MSEKGPFPAVQFNKKPEILPGGKLEDRSRPGIRYYNVDTYNPQRLFVFAEIDIIDKKGTRCLEFAMQTKLEEGRRSRVLRGKEQFEKILLFFKDRFDLIKGTWTEVGHEGKVSGLLPSDNLAQFNQATKPKEEGGLGLTEEDAALVTWTGKRCAEYGFGKINRIKTVGSPGAYTFVEVYFASF